MKIVTRQPLSVFALLSMFAAAGCAKSHEIDVLTPASTYTPDVVVDGGTTTDAATFDAPFEFDAGDASDAFDAADANDASDAHDAFDAADANDASDAFDAADANDASLTACPPGYVRASTGDCTDINECLTNNGRCGDPVGNMCTNTDGSYSCTCKNGWVIGRGSCVVPIPIDFPVGVSPNVLTANDFNGDDIADIAVTNFNSATVSILLGHGDGSFRPSVDYDVGPSPNWISAADFNGDHVLDLAVARWGGELQILVGTGRGTFDLSYITYVIGNPAYDDYQMQIADLNRDGALDIVVADAWNGCVSILLGYGDASFREQVKVHTGVLAVGLVLGDVNEDGRLDLVVTDTSSSQLNILFGNGDGTFQLPRAPIEDGFWAGYIASSDLNGDGHLDIVTTHPSAPLGSAGRGSIMVFLGRGDGTFATPTQYNLLVGDASEVVITDFNGDGVEDLAVDDASSYDGDSAAVTIFTGAGDGTFTRTYSIGIGGPLIGNVSADFNRDGIPDVAMANHRTNSVSVLLGNCGGNFGVCRAH